MISFFACYLRMRSKNYNWDFPRGQRSGRVPCCASHFVLCRRGVQL